MEMVAKLLDDLQRLYDELQEDDIWLVNEFELCIRERMVLKDDRCPLSGENAND